MSSSPRYFRSQSGHEVWKVSEKGIYYLRQIYQTGPPKRVDICFAEEVWTPDKETRLAAREQPSDRDYYLGIYQTWLSWCKKQVAVYEREMGIEV